MNEDKITYEKKIESLEKENKIITEKLLNKANNIINSPSIDIPKTTLINKAIKENSYGSKLIKNHLSQTPDKREKTKFEKYNKHKRNRENNLNISNNKTNSPFKSPECTISLENNNTINYYLNTNNNFTFNINNINASKHQIISLKTLKDFMDELYASKANYDMKCMEFKLPKETLEEHMYTFLNKKYGLKKLIIAWARNIINGIKYYSKKDSFVLLFGKIMRNEQEEEARFIIQKVEENIEALSKQKKNQNYLKKNGKGLFIQYMKEMKQGKLRKKLKNSLIN